MSYGIQELAEPEAVEAKAIFRCLLALVTVILIGTCGFMMVEPDWGVWKSFFFTLITITTVGYGDAGLSESGQKFAVVLLLVGIGTATYSLSALVRIAIQCQLAWKCKMQKKINQLQDHFIICGFGRIGVTVCQKIAAAGVPFVVIERDEEACEAALHHGYLVIHGNSAEDDVLREAGLERARGVICVINSDAENVFITLCAREMNPTAFVASRAAAEGAVRRLERAGASLVISPYTTAGLTIANAILAPSERDVTDSTNLGALDELRDATEAFGTRVPSDLVTVPAGY